MSVQCTVYNVQFRLLLTIIILSTVLFAGCSTSAGDGDGRVPGNPTDIGKRVGELCDELSEKKTVVVEGKPNIAIIVPAMDHPGWISTFAGAIKCALENNAGVTAFSVDDDVDLQMSIMEDLIAKRIDGIVFVPTDFEALTDSVLKANAAKIPVVAADRSTKGGELDALVESDNIEIGREAAKQMVKLSYGKELKILNLQGNMATSAGVERSKGFVEEIAKYPNCKVVSEISGFWRPAKGNEAVLEAFRANDEINAIFVPSDLYTQGVIAALEQLGRLKPVGDSDHIILVTVDGQPIGIEYIRKDYVDIDLGQKLITMGELAVDTCLKLTRGEKIENSVVKLAPDIINKYNTYSPEFWANQLE